ncbi:hypothetical protein [Adhaeribacter aquaticus]|uniref:hypothetical protein n=1 Tax=Adhaeribacter aquaticus TaxID=299567 RepID=UPI00047A6439|nr:hypothetical protein [Adhaeribacter aquaticus]
MELICFESDYLKLYFDEETKLARAVWNGFLSGETMHNAVKQCIILIEEKNPVGWLADNRKLKAIRQKDQEWISENLMPRLAASSLRKLATLISEDLFSQMAVESLYTKASELIHFDHQYFKFETEAYKWLLNEQHKNYFQLGL